LLQSLSSTFDRFVRSEQSGSFLLMAGTLVALGLTNSALGPGYLSFWHRYVLGLSIEHWVNDALMAVFFLLIGLELERELYVGELSEPKKALLPMVAAIGGMLAPAAIHYGLNAGMPTESGFGIPMATDIAFALGVLALLGNRVPAALKVFLVAFAVMDDLGAIVIIAIFYTAQISMGHLIGALAVFGVLLVLNRRFRVMSLTPYLLGGAAMWYLMLQSGVHATVAGVMLAFAIPFSRQDGESPSHALEHALHRPVAFLILPIFALANAGILLGSDSLRSLMDLNSIGIASGLLLGKPVGVLVCCWAAIAAGICRLPPGLGWSHVTGAGMLGGIGFTMSIFITNLAFGAAPDLVNASKMAVLAGSAAAGVLGFLWLRFIASPPPQRTWPNSTSLTSPQ
jgi:NhaA family Na+:H+ antiporter